MSRAFHVRGKARVWRDNPDIPDVYDGISVPFAHLLDCKHIVHYVRLVEHRVLFVCELKDDWFFTYQPSAERLKESLRPGKFSRHLGEAGETFFDVLVESAGSTEPLNLQMLTYEKTGLGIDSAENAALRILKVLPTDYADYLQAQSDRDQLPRALNAALVPVRREGVATPSILRFDGEGHSALITESLMQDEIAQLPKPLRKKANARV